MNIAINTDPMDKTRTGIGNYTKSLVTSLLNVDKKNKYYLIHYNKSSHPIYNLGNEVKIKMVPIPPKKILTDIIKLPGLLKGIDLIHFTLPSVSNNISSIKLRNNKIMTIHDLGFMSYSRPKIYLRPSEWAFYSSLIYSLKKVIYHLPLIIAVSKNTKNDIIRYLNYPENRIRVVYEASDNRFRRLDTMLENPIGHSFILCVNLPPLNFIKTYYKYKHMGGADKLVITGHVKFRDQKKRLFGLITDLGLQEDIVLTGHVSDEELVYLYNSANLFVFPSLYEGFGLPPLEAMACGCPVIASDTTSLPEVVGNAGILISPYDIDGWARAMNEVSNNNGLRQDLINRGFKRAKMFSWEKAAKETCKVYEEVNDMDFKRL